MPTAARACFGGAAALAGGTVAAAVGHFASDCAVAAGIAVVLSAGSLPTAAAEVDAAERGTDQFESTLMGDLYGFAPPPSLVKCVGATLAGSMFAVLGMIAEGRRERRRKDRGGRPQAGRHRRQAAASRPSGCRRCPGGGRFEPGESEAGPEAGPGRGSTGGPNGQKPAWRRGSATRAEERGHAGCDSIWRQPPLAGVPAPGPAGPAAGAVGALAALQAWRKPFGGAEGRAGDQERPEQAHS
ncbi:unnamed protein product [Prorocentrum cordatum]|uniref:H(+)-exporting diphosphatase n=1 Tax=Prorocentrum cordatum TaxID=2364126 RepID=A0ABN9UNS0_9DINO|nr:unnamed protein product [Polarella glacialis]